MSIRNFINILNEYSQITLYANQEKVFVTINPEGPLLEQLLQKSSYSELRCYYDADKFYFWANEDLFHSHFAEDLNIDFNPDYAFYLNIPFNGNNIVLTPSQIDDGDIIIAEILNHPYIQKWFTPNNTKTELLLKSSLTEYASTSVPSSSGDIQVAINPNKNELKWITDRSIYKELRGLYDEVDDAFYFWDASKLIHNHMANKLNLPDESDFRLTLYKHSSNNEYYLSCSSFIASHPYIERNFKRSIYGNLMLNVNKKLKEYATDIVYDGPIKIVVAINPPATALIKMLDKSKLNELRGYYINGTFYFWDAYLAIHANLVYELGLEYNYLNRLWIDRTSSGDISLVNVEEMDEIIKRDPYIQKYFNYTPQGHILKEAKTSMRDIMDAVDGKMFESIHETAKYNQQILDFLHSLGIDAEIDNDMVLVDRTSMVIYVSRNVRNLDEVDSYEYVLELIREHLPNNLLITWAGKTDDWHGISVYDRNFSR
ncbi:MAG: hypothetical protein HC836_31855 [Richelia sp. RM2_1_2]|nr:hypothetical protein [Richelia sp. RM2_1_2]